MFIVIGIVLSLLFIAGMTWYLNQFISDVFGEQDFAVTTYVTICCMLAGIVNYFAFYYGWTVYFVVMAVALAIGQLLYLEGKARVAFYLLIAGQIPSAIVAIGDNIKAGQWNWAGWIFSLLIFPLGEIALFKLMSFISAENDKSNKS